MQLKMHNAAVINLRMIDSDNNIHVSLVASKTKVALIRHLIVPRLELSGALLLSRLITHAKDALSMSVE